MSAQDIKTLRDRTGAGFLDCKIALEATDWNIETAIKWLQEKGIAKAAKKAGRIAAEGLVTVKVDGNDAIIIEINSETDFVAKNEQFIKLVNDVAKTILATKPKDQQSALKVQLNGKSIEDTLIEATVTIGEKISFRRFRLIKKTDLQVFGPYLHQGGKIGTIVTLEGKSVDVARGVAMHVVAINPTYMCVDEIDQAILDKKLIKLKQEAINLGKPENIAQNIAQGRLNKELSEDVLTKQEYVKGEGESVEKFLSTENTTLISIVRYAVGEGIEKKEDNFAKEVIAQITKAQG